MTQRERQSIHHIGGQSETNYDLYRILLSSIVREGESRPWRRVEVSKIDEKQNDAHFLAYSFDLHGWEN